MVMNKSKKNIICCFVCLFFLFAVILCVLITEKCNIQLECQIDGKKVEVFKVEKMDQTIDEMFSECFKMATTEVHYGNIEQKVSLFFSENWSDNVRIQEFLINPETGYVLYANNFVKDVSYNVEECGVSFIIEKEIASGFSSNLLDEVVRGYRVSFNTTYNQHVYIFFIKTDSSVLKQ